MTNAIKVFIWFILTIFIIDFGFELITMANTFLNIIGATIVFAYVLITIKTKCLTNLKLKQDEKN